MTCIKKSALVAAGLVMAVSMTRPAVAQTAPTQPGSVADGDACTANADCSTTGATCTAPAGSTAKVCTPAPAAKLADGAACKADGDCESGYCDGQPAVCSAQGDKGTACTRPEACSSGACDKGKCVECTSDADCGNGEVCTSNACVTKPGSVADGDACTADADCKSGSCKDDGNGTTKCQPKVVNPAPQPNKPTIPNCPPGTLATEYPAASGNFVCVTTQAPQPTAPVPVPAPQAPAAPSPEQVCGSFPMSDTSPGASATDNVFGCVAFAAAQVCGQHKAQTWTDCASLAARIAKGGAPATQRFFAAGLGLIREKLWNRSSHWLTAKAEVMGMDAAALRTALRSAPEWTDLLRLATGTVTGGQRGIGKAPARTGKGKPVAPAPAACTGVSCQPPPPRCPPDANPALDASGEWGCHCQGTGLWLRPGENCR